MSKQIKIDGNDMRDIIKATNQSQKAMLSFAEKTWGEKPTHKQVEVNMDSLLQPLFRTLEEYTDLVEDQR